MNIAIILAGGMGTRLGGEIPKQYIQVKSRPVIAYCLDNFMDNEVIDAIQIVADHEWHDLIRQCIEENEFAYKWKGFSRPGSNRQLSIFHGLEDIMTYADAESYVMIHDAARPLVKKEFIKECFAKAKKHDGVMPVLPMKDTVYLSKDGKSVTSLLDREKIFAGQAPEVFRLGTYFDANKALLPNEILSIKGSTEPAVMAGLDIVMIAGDEENFKITTQEDMERFKQKIVVDIM
ncbi:MAG: 2-C-methyl-D-erythritol 4-phosphate cytidylyltransferase [Lachnospiraceae bacterium]|nr:2-C-methyl-D-erythritol 4-phosphate cytidylyltransferase [Lachnospiraceae bacterium]